jgi:PEP-CTERM motif
MSALSVFFLQYRVRSAGADEQPYQVLHRRKYDKTMIKKLFAVALFSGALATSLSAIPISGTFTLVGTVNVNTGLIEWVSNTNVTSQATISSGGLTGSFIGTGGQTVTINTLTNAPGDQPVNTPFPAYNFIDFLGQPTFPELEATFIPVGTGSSSQCSTNPALAAVNQTCTLTPTTTPPAPNGSPFTFTNNSNGAGGCCSSTATWTISGVTSDGLSTWTGIFNTTYDFSYQQALANFVSNGSATNAYSGAFTVTMNPAVPEPSTFVFMGIGVVLMWLGTSKFGSRKN